MEKMNTVQPLFPHLPERLAGLEELAFLPMLIGAIRIYVVGIYKLHN